MSSPDDMVKKLTEIDSPTMANAIETLNVRNRFSGFCNRDMKQLTPEMGVLCGYAVTIQAETATAEPCGREEGVDKYLEVCQALQEAPKPAVVVFQEFGSLPEYSAHIGEVLATMFQRFGAIGVVSDSAVRDIREMRQLNFQAFAPGTVASHANFAIRYVQTPVVVCGMTIHPGDLLHGDENGLIKIPVEGREQLPELADKVLRKEKTALDYIKGEEVTLQGIRERLTH
ncbi:MAG: RraA family protein [Verrucomicrobiota bacterium]